MSAPDATKPTTPKTAESKPKRARKPRQTITMSAAEARALVKSLSACEKFYADMGDIDAARKLAATATGLSIAIRYGQADAK